MSNVVKRIKNGKKKNDFLNNETPEEIKNQIKQNSETMQKINDNYANEHMALHVCNALKFGNNTKIKDLNYLDN